MERTGSGEYFPMTFSSLRMRAISSSALAAILAGCGAVQPSVPAQGAAPQSGAAAANTLRDRSWMRPEEEGSDLLYASDSAGDSVYVFTYPAGKLVGTLSGFDQPVGECVDNVRNVWIVNSYLAELVEYAHGGTTPIATLDDADGNPEACAVSPITGDVAVTNPFPGNVGVYHGASGSPTIYADADFTHYAYPAYDSAGNLFVDGDGSSHGLLAELAVDSESLSTITIDAPIAPSSMQWVSPYLVVANAAGGTKGPQEIDRLQVSGSVAQRIGATRLKSPFNRKLTTAVQFWVQGSRIVGPSRQSKRSTLFVDFWRYPSGGMPTKQLQPSGPHDIWGVVVSRHF
jgi:hypothetical protein